MCLAGVRGSGAVADSLPCVYTPTAGRALAAAHPVAAAPVQVGQRAKFRRGPVTTPLLDLSRLPGQRRWALLGPGRDGLPPMFPPCRALVCPAGWLAASSLACLLLGAQLVTGSGGVCPLCCRRGAAWGGTGLDLASRAVWQAAAWSSCLRSVLCQHYCSLKTHVGQPGGECRTPPSAEQTSSLVPSSLVGTCVRVGWNCHGTRRS